MNGEISCESVDISQAIESRRGVVAYRADVVQVLPHGLTLHRLFLQADGRVCILFFAIVPSSFPIAADT